jgi:hypothetical protein
MLATSPARLCSLSGSDRIVGAKLIFEIPSTISNMTTSIAIASAASGRYRRRDIGKTWAMAEHISLHLPATALSA